MKFSVRRLWVLGALCASVCGSAQAATLQGKVTNATTGKPAASVEVILMQLQGGMQPVANTKSDSQGQFTFDNPAIGAQPMLVRAVYKGVNFHQPLPPGKDSVEVNVYDVSGDAKTVTVPSHLIIFQPNGLTLTVAEQLLVRNDTKPPVAFFRADGNFQFSLPEKADLKQVAAAGPAGMPVTQTPIEKGGNKYAFAYAFRPGDSEVRLAYELPYTGDTATLKVALSHGEQRIILVVPPTVTIAGDQLNSAGQEQGMNLFEHTIAAGATSFTVKLSGTAPPPQEAGNAGGDSQSVNGRQGAEDNSGGGIPIQVVPGRLDSLKWWVLGILVIAFAGGGYLLSRKTVVVPPGGVAVVANPVSAEKKKGTATGRTGKAEAAVEQSTSMAALDQQAAMSLDGLKDLIFKLELRRQAGTISETEYAAERARAEQILRDLVRG
ncbi:MAG TPA: carboxypeptidase-like regulatory domain-containing protein [Candidatus Dormibacteraeota bacterium]|nr:carboxypeptidase-like regulatory domain-containing protein [Candidatus Dormibacteraeota bacterium]